MSKSIPAAREVPTKSTNVRATLWLTRAALAVLAWISTTWAAPSWPRSSRVACG
jgi:hypothetical protein